VDPASGTFEEDTELTITATPATDYEFTGWSGDISSTENPLIVTLTSDLSIVAEFAEIANEDVTLVVNIVGEGTVEPNGGTYTSGTTVDLLATPATGYEFQGWSGDLSGTSTSESILLDEDKTVTATFTLIDEPVEYTLSVSTSGSGSVNPEGGIYEEGTVVSLTATPASGYVFESWSGDASGTSATISITMDSDKDVTANFVVEDPPIDCENPVSISIPFVQNGAGEYCWVTTTEMAYINSWNLDELTINGVDFTNTWAGNLPPANANGEWIIHYIGPFGWSHFEAPAAKSGQSELSQNDIHVYPNPFTEEVNIDFSGIGNIRKIEVIGTLGQVIQIVDESQLSEGLTSLTIEEEGNLFILRIHTENDRIIKTITRK
jgi:uncharacterized repeat protein (TIGR02543 family)